MTAWPPTRISSPLSKTGSISAWAATRKKLRRDTSALTILLSLYETWRKRFGGERPKADSRASVFGIKRFSFNMVGAGRFERPTPCAQGRWSARAGSGLFSSPYVSMNWCRPGAICLRLLSLEALSSNKIVYSGLAPPDVPFVVPRTLPAEPRRSLHVRVVRGLAFQFIPDGAISFEPLLIHPREHQNVRFHIVVNPNNLFAIVNSMQAT